MAAGVRMLPENAGPHDAASGVRSTPRSHRAVARRLARPLWGLFGARADSARVLTPARPALSEVASRCPDVAHVWIGRLARHWCADGVARIRRVRGTDIAGAGFRRSAIGAVAPPVASTMQKPRLRREFWRPWTSVSSDRLDDDNTTRDPRGMRRGQSVDRYAAAAPQPLS
jgi:hypothetical protein